MWLKHVEILCSKRRMNISFSIRKINNLANREFSVPGIVVTLDLTSIFAHEIFFFLRSVPQFFELYWPTLLAKEVNISFIIMCFWILRYTTRIYILHIYVYHFISFLFIAHCECETYARMNCSTTNTINVWMRRRSQTNLHEVVYITIMSWREDIELVHA